MNACVTNGKFYYCVQVYVNEHWEKGVKFVIGHWETVETFKHEGDAIRLMEELRKEPVELTINEIYKKYLRN